MIAKSWGVTPELHRLRGSVTGSKNSNTCPNDILLPDNVYLHTDLSQITLPCVASWDDHTVFFS